MNQLAESDGRWDEIDIRPESNPLPLLADGEVVDVAIVGCAVVPSFDNSWRLILTCQVIEDDARKFIRVNGEEVEMRLPLYCKMPRRKGKSGPFEAAKMGSKFYRLWVIANRGCKPLRRDRMSTNIFKDRYFQARTRVVTTDHLGHAVPPELRHSVVDELLLG